jgi:hypothetical protein
MKIASWSYLSKEVLALRDFRNRLGLNGFLPKVKFWIGKVGFVICHIFASLPLPLV